MLTPTIFLLGLGFGAAIMLAVASKVFYVWEDPKVQQVEDALLGANCGGCGYPGCSAAAAAVVAGKAGADICVAGGLEIAMRVAAVMGLEVEIREPRVAYSSCRYNLEDADTRFVYSGVNDCRAAAAYGGGPKECPIGCIGLGTCYRACPFGAIEMSAYGLPVFDRDKCRACGICVEVCPKDIIYLTSTTNRMIGDFRTDECTTPCQRACPTGIDIPGYIRQIRAGDYREALRIIKERCPLPLIVGRICPAPCEMECRRMLVEQSLGINDLKRFVADREMSLGEHVHPFRAPATGKSVAVIGGGAQGLATAYYLACLGHRPTIFESEHKLGGIIRKVIPPSRLPEHVLDWEIEGILNVGVEARTGITAGRDFTLASLLDEGYGAVVLATGGIDGRKVMRGNDAPDRLVPGVTALLDHLAFPAGNDAGARGRVYLFGAGTTTMAAARGFLEGGADTAVVISPYGRDEMESRGIDVEASGGVEFLFSTVISGLRGEGDALRGLLLAREDCPVEEVPADALVAATGRISDMVFIPDDADGERRGWRTLEVSALQSDASAEDIFRITGFPNVNDNLAVVRSIGRGRRIARGVHLYLEGKEPSPQANQIKKWMKVLDTKDIRGVDTMGRTIPGAAIAARGLTDPDVLFFRGELAPALSEEEARNESRRCLDCGLLCYRKTSY
ncbi:MAG: FAD-dependent oxidoreductase [Spirochaetes bacterium]|nr:FAD-dependent oxidoreductase [Spirochaetota bacterium]